MKKSALLIPIRPRESIVESDERIKKELREIRDTLPPDGGNDYKRFLNDRKAQQIWDDNLEKSGKEVMEIGETVNKIQKRRNELERLYYKLPTK